MEAVIDFFVCIGKDEIIFLFIQIFFVVIWIYAEIIELTARGGVVVTRGKESVEHFFLFYGITSLIVIEVISATDFLSGYKVVIMGLNLLILTRLSFFVSWYRNKIMGFLVKVSNKREFEKKRSE